MIFSYAGVGNILFRGDLLGITSSSFVITSQDLDLTYAYYPFSTDGVSNRNGGSGAGSYGGFDIGPHVLFKITNGFRSEMMYYFGSSQSNDTIGYKEIRIEAIRGDDTNGADQPNTGRDLTVGYRLSGSYGQTSLGTILEHDSSDGTSETVVRTFTLPEEAQTDQGVFITIQHVDLGNGAGEYGVKSVVLVADEVERPPITTYTVTKGPPGLTLGFSHSGSGSLHSSINSNTVFAPDISHRYDGSGSIPRISGVDLGNVSYSYTPTSVVPFIYVDLGTLGAPTATIDHGSVTEPTAGQEDWGDLRYDQQTRFPFGVVRLASSTTFVVKKVFVGSGQLFELGEAFTRLQAPWIVEGTISLRGEANAAFLYRYDTSGGPSVYGDAAASYSTQYNGSGSLFSGSFTGEAKATVYPEQPRYSDANIDYANDLFTNNPWPESSNDPTLGTLLRSGGSGTGSYGGFNVGPHVRFGGTTAGTDGYRRLVVIKDLRNVDRLEIYAIKGNGSNGGEEPDSGEDLKLTFNSNWVDYFGDIFTVIPETDTDPGVQRIIIDVPEGAKVEDSEFKFTQYPTSGGGFDNYGVISVRYLTASEPTDGDTRKTLFEVGGDALVLSSLRHIGSGTLFNLGNNQPLRTFAYDGSGTLFGFGNESRRLTYSYPGTDLFTYEDYGQVAAATTQPNEDFGSLFRDPGDDVYEIFDRGEILVNYTKSPFGLFKLRSETIGAKLTHITGTGTLFNLGDARSKGPQNHYGEGSFTISGVSKTTFSLQEFGSGFISALSGAAEATTASPDQEHKLLDFKGIAGQSRSATPAIEGLDVKVLGNSLTKFIPRYNGRVHLDIDGGLVTEKVTLAHLGTGVLFDFIGAEERRVFSYNTSSIDFITHPDYGSVANAATIFDDYGTLDLRYTGETGWMSTPDIRVDYQGILDNYTNYPFGLLPLKGTAETPRVRAFSGSGTFTVGGDVFIFVPPVWSGSGDITIQGSAEEVFVSREQFQTLFEFKGALENINIGRGYQGTGVISTLSGAAESFTGNPPEREALFSFSGIAQSRFIPRYNGAAHLDLDGGLVTEKVTLKHFGSGILFDFVGADEARVYSYNNSSTDFLVPVDLGSVATAASTSADPVALYPLTDFGTLDLAYTGERGWFSTPDDRQDWQHILDHDTTYPFGLFERFGGTAVPVVILSHKTSFVDGGDRLFAFRGEVGIRFPNVQSGLGGFRIFGAATSEKVGVAEKFQVLFQFGGRSEFIRAFSEERDVEISISGQVGVTFTGNTVQDATIFISGASSEIRSRGYQGTGFISTLSGAAESFTGNPVERQILFDITGQSVLRATKAHEGSGTLFGLSGAAESTTVDEVFATLFNISGASTEVRARGYEGTGRISTLSGVAESFTASPDDLFSLFDFTGGITSLKSTVREVVDGALFEITGEIPISLRTFAEQPEVQARISGNVREAYVPNWNGSGRISALSGSAESFTVNPTERQLLFSISGFAEESFSFGNYTAEGNINLSGQLAKTPNRTFAEQPFGTISVFGVAGVLNVDVYLAEGTIFSRGLVSESKTVKIPGFVPSTLHLLGTATESAVFNPPDITTHIILSGEGVVPLRVFAEEPTVRIALTGTAVERQTDAYLGTGAIFSNGISSEAITKKLPEFTAHLKVSGFVSQKATFREIFSGSLFTFRGSTTPENLTFVETKEIEIDISGVADTQRSKVFTGSGRISTLSGAAESATFNPLERQLLFSATGFAVQKASRSEVGSGGIKLYTEAADIRFTPNWNVEGTIPVSGIAEYRTAKDFVGEGRISTLSGAAESATFNPLEKQLLFSFTGKASIASAVSEVKQVDARIFAENVDVHVVKIAPPGGGTATISGVGVERSARDYIGQIHIGTFSGAAESATFNPLEKQLLFSATGIADSSISRIFTGTGNLYAISGASESRAVVPSIEGLYDISGEARIVITLSHVGDGNLFGFVSTQEAVAYDYVGEQVLFSLSGTARERVASSEVVFGSIFSFSGAAERVAFAPSLQADINFAGVAQTPRSRAYEGRGKLPVFGGAAESRTITYENVAIFEFIGVARQRFTKTVVSDIHAEISGSAVESFDKAPYVGQTEVQLSGTAAEKTTANPPEEGTEIATDGEAKVLRSFGYEGSGQFKVHGDTIIGISLRIFGTGSIKINGHTITSPLLGHRPDVNIIIQGVAATVKISVAPKRTYGWII